MTLNINAIHQSIGNELNTPPGRVPSQLNTEIDGFLKGIEGALALSPDFQDPAARNKKLAVISANLKKSMQTNAAANAERANAGEAFESPSGHSDTAKGFKGMIDNLLDMLVGSMGGAMGFIWSILKQLPGVSKLSEMLGAKAADVMSGDPEEVKDRKNMANAVAAGFALPVTVEGGYTFTPSASALEAVTKNLANETSAPASPPTPNPMLLNTPVPRPAVIPGTGAQPADAHFKPAPQFAAESGGATPAR